MFTFVLASVLLILTPGPDNLYVIATAGRFGLPRAIWLTAGLCSGLLFHTLAVILGLAILIKSSPLAFTVIKIAGAAYLVYLAWHILREPPVTPETRHSLTPSGVRSYFLRGVIMNVSNPKVGLFFLAFLPQFASEDHALPMSIQLLILGMIFQALAFLIFSTLAWLSCHGTVQRHTSPSLQRYFSWILAGLFIVLAVRLVFTEAV